MNQIVGHVIEQAKEHLVPWIQDLTNDVVRRVKEIEEDGAWPYETVSPEYFLMATKQLLNTVSDIEKEYDKDFPGPVEVLHDRIAYSSVEMLKCVQQMELETIGQAAVENTGTSKLNPNTAKYNTMHEMLDWAREILYDNNNTAIGMMIDTYTDKERPPLYIEDENEKDYTPQTAIAYADNAIYAHEDAFSSVIDNSRNIIKHGLPPETNVGKIVDKLRPVVARIRAQNEELIKNLLSKEMDIDYIQNFVCHNLKKQSEKFLAIAILEESYLSTWDEEFDGRSDFRDVSEAYTNAAKEIKNAIGDMRKFEAKLMPQTTINISKSVNGSYAISVTQGKGLKREAEIKGDNVEYKQTVTRRRQERSRMMKLGKMSQALRIEKESYIFTLKGKTEQTSVKTHDQDKDNEKKTTTKEQSYGEVSTSKTHTTKVLGSRQTRLNLRFHAARLAGRKIKSHSVGPYTEQKEIASGNVEVLGGSASAQSVASDKIGTPVIQAEIHPVQAGASVLGIGGSVSAGASISAGKQLSAEDIVKSVAEILIKELQNGSAANITKIIDEVAGMLNGIDPSTNIDWGSISISSGNMDILTASVQNVAEDGSITNADFQVEVNSPLAQDVADMIETANDIVQEIANEPEIDTQTTEPQNDDETIEEDIDRER